MAAFLELRRHSSFTEETVTQRQARFEGHLSEVLPIQETAAGDTVVLASDDESPQPRSKLRRRWRLQATTAPITPPLHALQLPFSIGPDGSGAEAPCAQEIPGLRKAAWDDAAGPSPAQCFPQPCTG